MSKELEALNKIWRDAYPKACETWSANELCEHWRVVEKALTPPTADEVCKALSDYLKDKVIYNDRFGFICNDRVIICLYPNNVLSFNDKYPAYIHNIVGRFYESLEE